MCKPLATLTEVDGRGGFIAECAALESVEPVEFSQVYSFEFLWLTNLQRVESESDGSDLIQIRGTIDEPFWSLGLSPEIEAIYAECGIDPKEQFDLADIPTPMRDYFPDRFKGEADIWLDPTTFYVHRLEWRLGSLNGERLITTTSTDSLYSLFNNAALPGPLPE